MRSVRTTCFLRVDIGAWHSREPGPAHGSRTRLHTLSFPAFASAAKSWRNIDVESGVSVRELHEIAKYFGAEVPVGYNMSNSMSSRLRSDYAPMYFA
jgi:hypothetical protein